MGEMAAQTAAEAHSQNPNEAFLDTIMFEPELVQRESTIALPVAAAAKKGKRSSGLGLSQPAARDDVVVKRRAFGVLFCVA